MAVPNVHSCSRWHQTRRVCSYSTKCKNRIKNGQTSRKDAECSWCPMTSKPQTIHKDNRHITVTEAASQFAISIRQVQLTVHHDPEFKKAFARSVYYEELCKEHIFCVRKPACNIQTNADASLLTTEQETVHRMDNSYTSKTEGILGRTICQ